MNEHKLYEFDWNLSLFPICLGIEMVLIASLVLFAYSNELVDFGNVILLYAMSLIYLLYRPRENDLKWC
jgi:hypothetical protein